MARLRICMRKIKEILRLKYALKKSQREISQACRIGKTTVQEYLKRAESACLTWPLAEGMTEEEIWKQLYPGEPFTHKVKAPIPFQYICEELKRPNVTLSLLWEEYKSANPDGYQYSWFSEQIREYRKSVNYSMRQEHKAGEKGFVDFGKGLDIMDRTICEPIPTRIFVFVWGASKKTYAEATFEENKEAWIRVNKNAIEYSGCCPKAIVPDNLKAAVTKACRYEPELNRTYEEFAQHYGTVILPARSRKPKDKALAENGIKLAKRWILSRLRNKVFFSLAELNAAIKIVTDDLNTRKMKKIGKSRDELFLSLDKPNALPLPEIAYEYAEWKKAKVNINYHIGFEKHEYSVPYTYIHKEVEIKATANIVEVYFKGQRICLHRRSFVKNGYTTLKEHMPLAHQRYLEWTPERILEWAGKYGKSVKVLVECIMNSRKFPEQAYKSCLGIIRLRNHYTEQKLNAACERALRYRIYSYKGVKNILQNNLENEKEPVMISKAPLNHENIRGAEYYTSETLFQNVKEG